MSENNSIILTHGGAGSKSDFSNGTEAAGHAGINALKNGASAIDAAVQSVIVLENDSRFNAGIGSARRSDGSIQMDASCMDSHHRFGAVTSLEGFKNPIKVARALMESNPRVLSGNGAAKFAKENGYEILDTSVITTGDSTPTCDTVGCVIFDGENFAAALSTGGTRNSLPGRVGDVPFLGCGLYAGPYGAVAATGFGEAIIMNLTAFRAYQMLEEGMGPNFVLDEVLDWFDDSEDIGLLLINRKDHAAGSNRTMAWSAVDAQHT